MAIVGTSRNYTGRKVDLSLHPEISIAATAVPARLSGQSRAIAGPSKAAQNFVRILLTPLGQYRAHSLMGSRFIEHLRDGSIRFAVDLKQLFSREALGVTVFMDSVKADDTPFDEQISTVSLTNYELDHGSLNLTIELSTRGGDRIEFLLPVVWSN